MPNQPNPTLEASLLKYLYQKTSGKKPPLQLDIPQLAYDFGTDREAIRQCLNRLLHKHCIKKVNKYNHHWKSPTPTAKRLIQLLLNDGFLPWDRKGRVKAAYRLGIKPRNIRRVKYDVDHLLHTELGETNNPTQIMLLSEPEAHVYMGDDLGCDPYAWEPCYKYLRGHRRTRRQPIRSKVSISPTHLPLKPRVLLYVLNSGGAVQSPVSRQVKSLGCQRRSYERVVSQLVQLGLLVKTANGIRVLNNQRSADFLLPWNIRPTRAITTTNPIPPRTLLAVSCRNGGIRKSQILDSQVSAFDVDQIVRSKTATACESLFFAVLRERLTAELHRMIVQYPRRYEEGQAKIMDTRKQIKALDDEELEALRIRGGINYGKQKRQVFTLLQKLQEYLELPGVLGDPLVNEGITRIRWALPELELPDRDLCDQLSVFVDSILPVDCYHRTFVELFIEQSKTTTLSEFVCRGGLDLLFRIMDWDKAHPGVPQQRVAWDLCAYIGYIERNPFNERWPEQFPNITLWDGLATQESYWTGETVELALGYFLAFEGYSLGSLNTLKPMICKALCTRYPIRLDGGGIDVRSVWDGDGIHGNLGEFEEDYNLLCQWNLEWLAENEPPKVPTTQRYSLRWYEAKYAAMQGFAMPGDIEIIREKISALRKWKRADVETQKNELVPVMNRPSKNEDPRLSWQAWSAIAEDRLKDALIETEV